MNLPVALRAKIAYWLQGCGVALLSGVGAALMAVTSGMSTRDIFLMCKIQALIHVGLYLNKGPAKPGQKEQ